jgi:flagellar basal body-associated protein FliL
MVATLTRPAEKPSSKGPDKPPAPEKPQVDLKWVLAALGLAVITMGSVVIGIQLAPNKILIKEQSSIQLVERIIKPGPTFQVMQGQVLNLQGGRYLRMSVALQFVENHDLWTPHNPGGHGASKPTDPVAPYSAMLKDVIISTASRHNAPELLALDGKERLKESLKLAINREWQSTHGAHGNGHTANPEVYRVYFTDFVIQ